MSFSKEIKEELSKISNLANKDIVRAELLGYLVTNNIDIKKGIIRYSTESEYNINRFAKLLNNMNIVDYKIEIQGKVFSIVIKQSLNLEEIVIKDSRLVFNDKIKEFCNSEVLEKALVRGCFLGSGSLNNPEKIYHLEMMFADTVNVDYIMKTIQKYDISMKKIKCTLYLKDGEEISKFLAFIGANNAVLKFEEIRVIRDMRNNVNRIVNCETANLNKIVNASMEQIENIKLIKKANRFNELSENLREIAELRLDNPEASLIELGQMLKNPIGKSGVNYRLKAIEKIANEIKEEV